MSKALVSDPEQPLVSSRGILPQRVRLKQLTRFSFKESPETTLYIPISVGGEGEGLLVVDDV